MGLVKFIGKLLLLSFLCFKDDYELTYTTLKFKATERVSTLVKLVQLKFPKLAESSEFANFFEKYKTTFISMTGWLLLLSPILIFLRC